jgi:hypothetical protein
LVAVPGTCDHPIDLPDSSDQNPLGIFLFGREAWQVLILQAYLSQTIIIVNSIWRLTRKVTMEVFVAFGVLALSAGLVIWSRNNRNSSLDPEHNILLQPPNDDTAWSDQPPPSDEPRRRPNSKCAVSGKRFGSHEEEDTIWITDDKGHIVAWVFRQEFLAIMRRIHVNLEDAGATLSEVPLSVLGRHIYGQKLLRFQGACRSKQLYMRLCNHLVHQSDLGKRIGRG